MTVTAMPNAPTARASNHGAPSPRIGRCGRSTSARPGGDLDDGVTGGAALSVFDGCPSEDAGRDEVLTEGTGEVGLAVGVG